MLYFKKVIYVLLFLLAIPLNPFEQTLAKGPQMIQVSKTKSELELEIEANKEKFEQAPENAYIDKIFKKTPGRNGLKVDIKKSYERMKENNMFDENLLVYEQIMPEVKLEDLPAAPIYRGHPEKKMVTFLINVAWGTEHLPKILKVLEEKKIKANFFLDGKWADENKAIVKLMLDAGHVIGSHAYNHPDMALLTEAQMVEQMEKTNAILSNITGQPIKWFAPPSGSFNDLVVETAVKFEMETVLWTVDTVDWKKPSVSVMIKRVLDNIHPGAMILMHPTSPTANGLLQMIEEIEAIGLKIGSIEHLLSETR